MVNKNGTSARQRRANRALYMEYMTDKSREEIAEELGVVEGTVNQYITQTEWGKEVEEQIEKEKSRILKLSIEELKKQLREVGRKAHSAEAPQAVYTDDDGDLVVEGEDDEMHLVTTDIQLLPDEETRYFRRQEVRDILQEMRKLLGVEAVDKVEIEHSGDVTWSAKELEQIDEMVSGNE